MYPQSPYQHKPQPSSFSKGFFGAWGACAGCGVLSLLGFFGFLFLLIAASQDAGKQVKEKTKDVGNIAVAPPTAPIAPTPISPPIIPETPPRPDTELLEHHIEMQNDMNVVVGTIRNNTDRTLGYVQADVNFYDGNQIQLGSSMDNTTHLATHGLWRFKVQCYYPEARNSKIIRILSH